MKAQARRLTLSLSFLAFCCALLFGCYERVVDRKGITRGPEEIHEPAPTENTILDELLGTNDRSGGSR